MAVAGAAVASGGSVSSVAQAVAISSASRCGGRCKRFCIVVYVARLSGGQDLPVSSLVSPMMSTLQPRQSFGLLAF
jgi:hypothetical protein